MASEGKEDKDTSNSSKIQTDDSVQPGLKLVLKRLTYKLDADYFRKLQDTLCVWTGFFVFGFAFGQVGPALPDLQQITGVDLSTASWLFTASSFGYMFGCFLSGVMEKRFNPRFILCGCLLGSAVFTTITPWFKLFNLMVTARVGNGLFFGGIDTVSNAFLFTVWKNDVRTYIQIMYFLFASGGIIAPLVTTPFLSTNVDKSLPASSYVNNKTADGANETTLSNSTAEIPVFRETNVHFPFMISGILNVCAAGTFILIFFKTREHAPNVAQKNASETEKTTEKQHFSKVKYVTAVIILAILFGILTGLLESSVGLLMTFSLRHLKWTKPEGSLATTMFWVAYALGSFLCIFLVQCFRTGTLLLCYLLLSIISLSGLTAASIYMTHTPVWICFLLTGFSMSVMWPAVFTWTEERVTSVTGRIASLFLVAGSVCSMLNPLAIGYTMDNVANICYTYWILGEAVLLLILFLSLSALYWNVDLDQSGQPADKETK